MSLKRICVVLLKIYVLMQKLKIRRERLKYIYCYKIESKKYPTVRTVTQFASKIVETEA